MKKIYYKLNITLASPLAIGSGLNGETDKNVILNNIGKPYIPATAIAGVLKNYIFNAFSEEKANAIFGYIKEKSDEKGNSCVKIYDASYKNNNEKDFFISTRDCVKLENKVGVDRAKFDMQVVETGAEFVGYIELDNEDYQGEVEQALAAFNIGEITLGGKSTRGYGRVELEAYRKSFKISSESYEDWLNFDMFDKNCWNDKDKIVLNATASSIVLSLKLKNTSAISIREYTTEVSENGETMPDYMSMSLKSTGTPVIPGTSWAGAFRERFSQFAVKDDDTVALFGDVRKENGVTKSQISKIRFSESLLSGGMFKISTRNAIDRFSAGTKAGALYTEKTYFGGNCDLDIFLPNDITDKQLTALLAVLCDLDNGFLAVGGLTSIGRGLFKIENAEIRGYNITDMLREYKLTEIVKKVKGHDNKAELENKTIFAIWTDHTDFLFDISDLQEDKLLELRVFDENSEYRRYRSTIDKPFYERKINDQTDDTQYFDEEQYIDIDSTRSEGNVRYSTGGGKFHLPKDKLNATKIVIRNYIEFDGDGIASVCDWRIVKLKEAK